MLVHLQCHLMKYSYKILLFVITLLINLFLYIQFFYELDSIENVSCEHAIVNFTEENILKYNADISNVKNIPTKFEDVIITAFYFFPELENVRIEFFEEKISTTMNCRPNPWKLLKGKRHYEIRINNADSFEGPLLKDTPFNAQIGVIAHEFAHILDYEAGSIFRVIKRGLDYLNNHSKRNFEHEIDFLTIQKGFGHQLLDWLDFLMDENNPNITEAYRSFKREIYLDSETLSSLMESTDCY